MNLALGLQKFIYYHRRTKDWLFAVLAMTVVAASVGYTVYVWPLPALATLTGVSAPGIPWFYWLLLLLMVFIVELVRFIEYALDKE